jgi:hypothetical protein
MGKKKKKVEQAQAPTQVSTATITKAQLKSFFMTNPVIRNSEVREMLNLGKEAHQTAGAVMRAAEAANLLRRRNSTKQAVFYGPGSAL